MTATKTDHTEDALGEALAHAALFESLALCFRYPQADAASTLAALLEEAPQIWREALSNLSQRMNEVTETRFLQLFGSGGLCRDTESAYVNNRPMGGLLADLSGFYVAFGFPVNVAPTSCQQDIAGWKPALQGGVPLDHVATELSFISFLFAKEAHAHFLGNAEAVEICQQGRALFLREHLGTWIGSFASTVAERAPDTFHAQAAVLCAEAVRESMGQWGNGATPSLPLTHLPVDPWTLCDSCPAACGPDEEEWA